MKLNVMERLTTLGILPKEGNFTTLKVLRDLQMKLSFTEEEFKEFEVKQEGDQIRWNPQTGNEEKEIEIGEKATDLIINSLKELDKENKLGAQHMSLYEKFVEGGK